MQLNDQFNLSTLFLEFQVNKVNILGTLVLYQMVIISIPLRINMVRNILVK